MTPALKTELTSDGKYIIVTDETTYTTPGHSSYTLALTATLKRYEQDEALIVEKIQEGDHTVSPEVKDKWRVTLTGDGWHRYVLTLTDEAEQVTTFTKDCFEYPMLSPKMYKALEGYLESLDCNGTDKKTCDLARAIIIGSFYLYKQGDINEEDSLKRRGQYVVESFEQKAIQL